MDNCDLTKDEAGKFFISTLDNVKASSVNEKESYKKFISVDRLYRKLINTLNNAEEYISGLFVLRSHASFLSAGYLAFSGQLADSFALQRSALEAALYGLYVKDDSEKAEIWLRRNEEGGKQKSRSLFSYNRVIINLRNQDPGTADIVENLYKHAIDYGSHPNLASIMSNISIGEKPQAINFTLHYLNVGNNAHKLCMKRVSQAGVACMYIFNNIWKERYTIIGLSTDLDQVRRGL